MVSLNFMVQLSFHDKIGRIKCQIMCCMCFRSLSCQRITLHKNLFVSFVLNSIITVVWLTTMSKKQGHTNDDSVSSRRPPLHLNFLRSCESSRCFLLPVQASCKLLTFVHLYLLSCNYFWMLCEGIYLHTLIVVAVFAEKQHLMWYYLLGWGEQTFMQIFYNMFKPESR